MASVAGRLGRAAGAAAMAAAAALAGGAPVPDRPAAPADAAAAAPAGGGQGELLEELECAICMDARKDTLLMPCNHACVCNACAQDLLRNKSACPSCRVPIESAMKIFI